MAHRATGEGVCPWWLGYAIDNPVRRLLHDPRRILAPFVTRGMAVLDVGCGRGLFSLAAARLVGEEGRVTSVDVQQRMLDSVLRRAAAAGLAGRIRAHRCERDDLGVAGPFDFAVAFWMVHETPDAAAFLRRVRSTLRPGARLLVAEPRLHVGRAAFGRTLDLARAAGFTVREGPAIRWSRSALLENGAAPRAR